MPPVIIPISLIFRHTRCFYVLRLTAAPLDVPFPARLRRSENVTLYFCFKPLCGLSEQASRFRLRFRDDILGNVNDDALASR